MSDRTAIRAIFGVFFFESAVLGQWIPRIPDVKSNLGLSDAELGLALLSMPLGTLTGFSVAGYILNRIGLRNSCRIFLPLWALLFLSPAFARTLPELMLALLVSGLAIGLIETAMNTEAARLEAAAGRRIMSRCHGFWSLGTMAGALLGGYLAHRGVGVAVHFSMVLPILALCGYVAATALPAKPSADTESVLDDKGNGVQVDSVMDLPDNSAPLPAVKASLFTLPDRNILLLCIMPLGIMMVEGAFIDWSAVFMRDVMAASSLMIAVTYAFFSVIMAVVRLCGDWISERFGDVTVIRVSGLAATAGIALFSLAPDILWVLTGAAISGAGVAIVFPLAVSAAANRGGRPPAVNVAALNMIGFSAFFVAPPLIGFASDVIGLRYALLFLAPIAFATFLLAGEVAPKATDQTSMR